MEEIISFSSPNPNLYDDDKRWKCVFSQWYLKNFIGDNFYYDVPEITKEDFEKYLNNKIFNCREKWMMVCKALVFAKDEFRNFNINLIEKKIMSNNSPKNIKSYGRMILGFDENIWEKCRYKIVFNGNYLQFKQNEELKEILLNTKGIIVEGTRDKIWGAGLLYPSFINKNKWGLNLLGNVLMEVREIIKLENNIK